MDRLSQLRGGAGSSRDGSLDGSAAGDSFLTAHDTSSKYYSLSEDDSSFDITKDVSLSPSTSGTSLNDSNCFSNLSPLGNNYKIGRQIEAANILSGGVNIFDDNENSYDGNELVIDDNVDADDKAPCLKSTEDSVLPSQDDVETVDESPTLKSPECPDLPLQDDTVETGEKSPSLKSLDSTDLPLDKDDEQLAERPDVPLEQLVGIPDLPLGEANLPIDRPDPPVNQGNEQQVELLENGNLPLDNGEEQVADGNLEEIENRTEVVLQIDGTNVDAINIGTGLYLYRKEGEEELAAVQIVENEDPSFKFLKVRENAEGNLEVYEEIQEVVVVTQETPVKEGRPAAPSTSREVNKAVCQPSTSKAVEKKANTPDREVPVASTSRQDNEPAKKEQAESKPELNVNGKMVKFSESRKSPLMAYHSTPNKEGIPLTKTMVDQQLHPSRHSDNIKKTIEVHTDNCKQKILETPTKSKDVGSPDKISEEGPQLDKPVDKEAPGKKHINIVTKEIVPEGIEKKTDEVASCSSVKVTNKIEAGKLIKNRTNEGAGCSNINVSDKIMAGKPKLIENRTDKLAGCSNVKVSDIIKAREPKLIENITDEVASSSNVEVSDKSEAGKPELVENRTNEVTDSSNVKVSDKSEAGKPKLFENRTNEVTDCSNVNEMKAVVIDKVEVVDKVLIFSEVEKKEQESEHSNKIPHTSHPIEEILDARKSPKIEDKEALNKYASNKENVKESKASATASIVEAPKDIDNEKVKIPENVEPKENPVIKPIEIIEADDMEVDEDALVIEEHISDKQPEIYQIEKLGAELVSPSVEVQLNVIDKQKKQHALETESAKPTTPVEIKMNIVETLNKSNPSKMDTTTANSLKHHNVNIVINDSGAEDKSETKLKARVSLIEEKRKSTNSKDTQLKNNIKTLENEVVIESVVPDEKNTQKVEKPNVNEASIEIKSNNHIIEAEISTRKVNDSTSNIHNPPEKKISKLESVDKKIEKKEELSVKDLKDVKPPTLLPVKQQQQTSIPKLNQNIIKLPVAAAMNAVETKKEVNNKAVETKPISINNNHAPVPFGQWTEVNRQDFLNKIKESKVPVNMSNANQLKQPNDLNRRDVLKKIDSQRQTYNANVKSQESLQKGKVKNEAAFASKITPETVAKREIKVPVKSEAPLLKPKPIVIKKPVQEPVQQVPQEPTATATISSTTKKETQRKEINNQDLIDKTIEGIINRAVTGKSPEDVKQPVTEKPIAEKLDKKADQKINSQPTPLDAIEMKMNELHGIPFVERPPHELPRPYMTETKISPKPETQNLQQKVSMIPNLLPLTKSQQKQKDAEGEVISLETSREKSTIPGTVPSKLDEKSLAKPVTTHESTKTGTDKIITEKEFDKFARRNSVTYENCLTVTDSHQLVQTVVPKEAPPKKISRNEQMLAEAKAKSPHKHLPIKQYHPSKAASKYMPASDIHNKQYQSKLQLAYQTAITAKRRLDSPITIIEDKPVKVVYLDSNVTEYTPLQLNVQGRDLSPAKRAEPDAVTVGTGDSLDSDILDGLDDARSQDEAKTKSKHQRKQVLTPVDTPDLELIEPGDLGIHVSPKKKRKIDDRPERGSKNLVPKKSYLLGRSAAPGRPPGEAPAEAKLPARETGLPSPVPAVARNDAVSAIDNLVKAAELLETQSENMNVSSVSVQSVESALSTPAKRGRGRPRKNPPPAPDDKASPPKKPRLIDARAERDSSSDRDSSDDDAMIKENWTMGKINEKIVCPICNKLFRSENVVFKHVKHCAGPSPSRSDSDKRSPRRSRLSRDSESKSRASRQDDSDLSPARKTPSERKSKDSSRSSSDDVIPVETKESDNDDLHKKNESRKSIKPKPNPRTSNLSCEICGKSFRQLSYLVSHKLQHKTEDSKRPISEPQSAKSVFSCETCKKEFRKLHHLVQHRLIHNPVQSRALRKTSSEQKELQKNQEAVQSRALRKTSSEQKELQKNQEASKIEDQSAGFRCEPCDKSFRKLHHLVEHRETHDGINRQRSNSVTQVNPDKGDKEKLTPPPQCDICKKTFRKLHHLIEHKEQHLETSSEKSDDQKSVKSSLSTKDIIHECNLCYMVFPNEHSLNKHTVICLRKKKQSAAKLTETQEDKSAEDGAKVELPEESKVDVNEPKATETDVVEVKADKPPEKPLDPPAKADVPQIKEDPPEPNVVQAADKTDKQTNGPKPIIEKKAAQLPEHPKPKTLNKPAEPLKIRKIEEIIVIEDTPKKKAPAKVKVTPTVTKRQKVTSTTLEEPKAPVTSSDDDEVRYMFNPDFKEASTESKNFMKIRAKKRSSLQIERPNSKDLVRRRSLLQHPPKIPRLRARSNDVVASANPSSTPANRVVASANPSSKPANRSKLEIVEVPSTDSDDSDVKYSFPKTVPEKPAPPAETEKTRRKTMVEKRKSLSGIAKRKSLGKAIVKPAAKPSPAKPIKRRTLAAEHRCDCGQLFSSAALLARHASLAHTPPRSRRRGSPAPPAPPAPAPARAPAPAPAPGPARKAPDTARKTAKPRNRLHGGVPLPEKRASRK